MAGERIEFTPDQIFINEMLVVVVTPKLNEINTKFIHPSLSRQLLTGFMDHWGTGATSSYNELHQI